MLNTMKVKVVAGVLIVFLVGMLFGAVGTSAFIVRKMRHYVEGTADIRHPWLMRRLSRQLQFTAEQKPQVQSILEKSEVEIRQLVQRSLLEFKEIMERQRAELRPVLTPEQQIQLDKHFGHLQHHWMPSKPEGQE